MPSIISVKGLRKEYASGVVALHDVSLDIEQGEILALLGPNGAGKTTLISIICGITTPSGGTVSVGGHDIIADYRKARGLIGLVPQELTIEPFEKVMNTVAFSRGLFGDPPDPAHIERILRQLSLWDRRNSSVKDLSGGMKRRVLIAKALSHHPKILFLDEPTAGVDVELRKDMWAIVDDLRGNGVTIILTTHYIEEAEAIADRIGIINGGKLLLVEEKETLMRRLGQRQMRIHLKEPVAEIPDSLRTYSLETEDDGATLVYTYDSGANRTGITALVHDLRDAGLALRDLETTQRSLEEIFVNLVREER